MLILIGHKDTFFLFVFKINKNKNTKLEGKSLKIRI